MAFSPKEKKQIAEILTALVDPAVVSMRDRCRDVIYQESLRLSRTDSGAVLRALLVQIDALPLEPAK